MTCRILTILVLATLAACGDKAAVPATTETGDVAAAAVADVDAAMAEATAADRAPVAAPTN